MAKPMRFRQQQVIISEHAWAKRWPERAGIKISKTRLARMLRRKLTEGARGRGLYPDATGAVWVEVLPPWLWATARLTEQGWVVTTFTTWDINFDDRGVGDG